MSFSHPQDQRVLPLQTLLALQSAPPAQGSLPGELWEVGEIDSLAERTPQLLRALEELSMEDQHVAALVEIWNAARCNDPIGQRLLSSLFEVRQSGLELLRQMIRPSQLMRCCRRVAAGWQEGGRTQAVVQSGWDLAGRIGISRDELQQRPIEVLQRFHARAEEYLQLLLAGTLHTTQLTWLRTLAESELTARSLRLERMAEQVGAYDGRAIARVLPHLSREEERIRDTRAMLVLWPETDELRRRTPVLMGFLEERYYWKLVESLESMQGGRELAHALRLLPKRVPVTNSLLFVSAVLRELDELTRPAGAASLDAGRSMMVALQIMNADGSLSVSLEPKSMRAVKALVARLGLQSPHPNEIRIAFDELKHRSFLSSDATPMLQPPEKKVPDDIRQMVLDNIQNEHILSGFLGSPRVVAAAGLIEMVVIRTRSIKILLDIANRRELYSGFSNRNVPEALLCHPSNIPVSAIRKFAHVRYVDRGVLTRMANRGTRVRPEVRQLAETYLKSINTR